MASLLDCVDPRAGTEPKGPQEAPPILGHPRHGEVTGPYLWNPAGLTGRKQPLCLILGSRCLFGGDGRPSSPQQQGGPVPPPSPPPPHIQARAGNSGDTLGFGNGTDSAGQSPFGDISKGRTESTGVREGLSLTYWGSSSKFLPSWVLVSRVRNRERAKRSEVFRTPNSGAQSLSSARGGSLGPAECPGGRTAER